MLLRDEPDAVSLPSTAVCRVLPSTAAASFLHKLFGAAMTDAALLDLGVKAMSGGFSSILE